MIKFSRPFRDATFQSITQGFKPKEHEANDFGGKFGTFLTTPFNCKIVNIVGIESENDQPDFGSLELGYGIRMQSTEDPTISCTYWHCQAAFPYKKGDIVDRGKVVAMMGNSGFVTSNGVLVEIDRRLKPPFPGTHVHWSAGQEVGGVYTPLDPSQWIDWSLPINYNIIDTIKLFLISITNHFKK